MPHREVERAQRYDWPGNVRELQNAVERAVILARGGRLSLDLPQSVKTALPKPESEVLPNLEVVPEKQWRELERANILAALRHAGLRVSGKGGAAELLGINPGTLASRIKALGIRKRDIA